VLVDLDTVERDILALEHGYTRRERPGYRLGAKVIEASSCPPGNRLSRLAPGNERRAQDAEGRASPARPPPERHRRLVVASNRSEPRAIVKKLA